MIQQFIALSLSLSLGLRVYVRVRGSGLWAMLNLQKWLRCWLLRNLDVVGSLRDIRGEF